ncbi:hypothetical protein B484DRAFT_459187 [Ochromonadaceae sp. CCMP2298]|nr:hypothetical protein B484DRAFT_459187 [Ochromonadaceae sp. CCMP2298]
MKESVLSKSARGMVNVAMRSSRRRVRWASSVSMAVIVASMLKSPLRVSRSMSLFHVGPFRRVMFWGERSVPWSKIAVSAGSPLSLVISSWTASFSSAIFSVAVSSCFLSQAF